MPSIIPSHHKYHLYRHLSLSQTRSQGNKKQHQQNLVFLSLNGALTLLAFCIVTGQSTHRVLTLILPLVSWHYGNANVTSPETNTTGSDNSMDRLIGLAFWKQTIYPYPVAVPGQARKDGLQVLPAVGNGWLKRLALSSSMRPALSLSFKHFFNFNSLFQISKQLWSWCCEPERSCVLQQWQRNSPPCILSCV